MRRSIRVLPVIIAVCFAALAATLFVSAASYTNDEPRKPVRFRPAAEFREIKMYTSPSPSPTAPTPAAVPTAGSAPVIAAATESPVLPEEEPYIEVAATPDGTRTSLGIFTVTAYCACPKCCGKWSGHKMSIPTQGGSQYPVEGYTISVDPDVIPLRTVVELEGYGTRYAHDTGSVIKGKRIDLFFDSHEDALNFGKKKLEVWVYE